jgi:hypothetical protein
VTRKNNGGIRQFSDSDIRKRRPFLVAGAQIVFAVHAARGRLLAPSENIALWRSAASGSAPAFGREESISFERLSPG